MIKFSRSNKVFNIINITILSFLALLIIYPLYFIVIASISDPSLVNIGKVTLVPRGITMEGYKRIFKDSLIWRNYLNSIVYSAVGTTLGIALTMTIAFPLSRSYFLGRKFFNIIVMIPLFVSGGLIPTFITINKLNLVDSPWSIILLLALSVFNIIIARTFLTSNIPKELDEASYIDGANYLQYFFTVVIPLSKAIIAVLALYYAVGYWNEYFLAMIYLNTKELFPLQLKLYSILNSAKIASEMAMTGDDLANAAKMQQVAGLVKYGVIIISTVPMMIAYPFVQKYFVQGVMIGSIKG